MANRSSDVNVSPLDTTGPSLVCCGCTQEIQKHREARREGGQRMRQTERDRGTERKMMSCGEKQLKRANKFLFK